MHFAGRHDFGMHARQPTPNNGRPPPAHPFQSDQQCQRTRSEEHTSELQSLMRISYAVFCLKKKTQKTTDHHTHQLHHPNHTNTYNHLTQHTANPSYTNII